MVMIAHTDARELHAYAALRQVPAASLPGIADGAFLYLYDSPNGAIYGYYRPETIHAGGHDADYQLLVTDGRAVSCDCPSAVYRDGKPCKHVQEYNAQAIPSTAPTVVAQVVKPAPMTIRTERGTAEYAAWKADLLSDWD